MNQSKIGVRYAKALFELAKDKKVVQAIKEDMLLLKMISEQVEEFQLLVESPIIETKKKKEILAKLLKGKIDQLSHSFVDLVIENKREIYISDITRNFLDLARRDMGIKSAKFTTAVSVDEKTIAEVKKLTESKFESKVELETEINKDLLGGFILRVEDRQIDASIASKLNLIKSHLVNSDFEIKY